MHFFHLNYSSGTSILIKVADVLIDSLFTRLMSISCLQRLAFSVQWKVLIQLSLYQAMCTHIVVGIEHALRASVSEVRVVPLTPLYLSQSDLLCIIYTSANSSGIYL